AAKTAIMFLYDEEKINLNNPVSYYLPEFGNNGKENITIRDLLVYYSGLPENFTADINQSKKDFINSIMNLKAEKSLSDSYLNSIILQLVAEKITGKSLDVYLKEKLFDPLKLEKTFFNPPKERSEEQTSELQSPENLVCRLLLEKKNNYRQEHHEL